MPISIQEHSAKVTQKLVSTFEEMIPVRAGFSQFFPEETTPSLEVDIEVQRDNDLIAVDVVRFTEGNKNKYSRVTEHIFIPPFFKEDYDFQRDSGYMSTIALGVGMENKTINKIITQNALKALSKNKNKIERAIRKQQADVLQTGIITLSNGDNIDFKRKAASIVNVDTLGDYWSLTTAKPMDDIKKGMEFLRNVGNCGGASVNVVMRSDALSAFLATTQIKEQGPYTINQIQRINVGMPQFTESTGFSLHGQIAAGDMSVNLWTYNEKYTDASGSTVYYLDNGNVVMIPEDFQGKTIFGGLPVFNEINIGGVTAKVPGVVEAKYLLRPYSDEKTLSSTIELTSAPITIPFTVDKIYTMKVLA